MGFVLAPRGEIDTLCYPKVALLAYAIALVTYYYSDNSHPTGNVVARGD